MRHQASLRHPSFWRPPGEGTAGLRNPASRDPVRERGDQVFGERTRATAGSEDFTNDDFFPDLGNLVLDDMGENVNAGGAGPAAPYVILSFLFEIVVEFMFLVCALDVICSSTMLVRMISLISTIAVICSYFQQSKNLIRQFTPSGFAAHLKPPAFKGAQYKRWRMRGVYWFQTMGCYDATN